MSSIFSPLLHQEVFQSLEGNEGCLGSSMKAAEQLFWVQEWQEQGNDCRLGGMFTDFDF